MKAELTYNGKSYSFRQVALNYNRVRKQLPNVLGTVAMNYFKDSFRRGGWRDRNLTAWAPRKAKGKRDRGRAILVQSGRLRNSIRIMSATFQRTEVGTTVPYADAHNSGVNKVVSVKSYKRGSYSRVKETYQTRKGKTRNRTMLRKESETTVRAHSRKMNLPQRQFMGDSEVMFRKFDQVVIRAIDKVFEL